MGSAPLASGGYVLRSVADPLNRIYESKADPRRERAAPSEAVVFSRVSGSRITLSRR